MSFAFDDDGTLKDTVVYGVGDDDLYYKSKNQQDAHKYLTAFSGCTIFNLNTVFANENKMTIEVIASFFFSPQISYVSWTIAFSLM